MLAKQRDDATPGKKSRQSRRAIHIAVAAPRTASSANRGAINNKARMFMQLARGGVYTPQFGMLDSSCLTDDGHRQTLSCQIT
jgi:hypothetical protein